MNQFKSSAEIRDELAREEGWQRVRRHVHASGEEQWCWVKDNGDESFDHPVPDSIDGIIRLMPKGWDSMISDNFRRGKPGTPEFHTDFVCRAYGWQPRYFPELGIQTFGEGEDWIEREKIARGTLVLLARQKERARR
jgi:hypothetical protein